MNALSRRQVLGSGLVATSLTMMGADAAVAASRPLSGRDGELATLSPRTVRERIRLTGRANALVEDQTRLLGTATAKPLDSVSPRSFRPVAGEAIAETTSRGQVIAYGLAFRCDPRFVNQLFVEDEPLVASRFSYSIRDVVWTPGPGWPVYRSACPRLDNHPQAVYREARWHQIVPRLEGQSYFASCQENDLCVAAQAAQVAFDVNGSHHDDHRGEYVVTIWSWS